MSLSVHAGAQAIADELKRCGVRLVVSLPDTWLDPLLRLVAADPAFESLSVVREDEGVGICTGAYLGGMASVLVMQNAGLLLSANALATLAQLCEIPLLMLVSHRGDLGETAEQQLAKGLTTPAVLEGLGIPYWHIEGPEQAERVEQAFRYSRLRRGPVALLLHKRALLA